MVARALAVRCSRPAEVVETRRAEREGGDVRSGGGAEAADAANPLREPVGSLGAMGWCLPGLLFGFVCVL